MTSQRTKMKLAAGAWSVEKTLTIGLVKEMDDKNYWKDYYDNGNGARFKKCSDCK